MEEIIKINQITKFAKKLKKPGQKLVLVGGCFDILHPGHIIFLEKAKQRGDVLVVLLESDEKVKKLKGIHRPIYTQTTRAQVLSALRVVDYVIMLPMMETGQEYGQLISKIQPDIIAATTKDTNLIYHQRAAKLVGAQLKLVTKVVGNYSTSSLTSQTPVK